MKQMRFWIALSAVTTAFGLLAGERSVATDGRGGNGPAPVVFNTPADDEKGVMILGNGELGATAWLGADGVLHTVLQNSDSWNEGGRHVKTGAIDYETGMPVDAGTFRQELSMVRGEFEATWKSGGQPVSLRYRIQQGTDSIAVCDVRGVPKAEAKVVNWRLYPGGAKEFGVGEYELGTRFCEGAFQKNVADMKFTISADRLVLGGWCHVNRNETVAELMKVYDHYQATGDLGKPDLLSDRVFGGVTKRMAGTTDVSSSVLFLSAITCFHPCKDEAEWLRRTKEMLDKDGWDIAREEAKRAEHVAAWAKFWNRSRIEVTPAAGVASKLRKTVADECAAVTRAYAAQRYLTACAGRGRLPIRFNGSIFTISHKGDPDYRRWGSGYWWQNTRLPYYPMFAAGDLDMLQPLFRMYLGLLDFNVKRTRKYLGHGGAYFPECMQPWGDHFIGSYGPMCEWKDRADKLQASGYHKYEWLGQLEISLMAIRYWQYTQDDAWFKEQALPAIREYVRYFDEHYALDAKGRYHMNPAQAAETWWDCTNPMTEVSGLTRVTDILLALPDSALEPGDRELFTRIRSRVPDLPTRRLDGGGVVFAPGEKFANHRNVETPELYCVFPFRLCSFEKPNAEIGRRTYRDGRFHKLYRGWSQDEMNAAYLGMTEEAREHIADRALTHSKKIYRWPTYWGPNFDWCPDQDEGGIYQNTIQSMLMQFEGRNIFLMPAWPKDWNCDFKLHAPYNTTVEGRVENGEVKDLVVTPASRRADVEVVL